MDGIPVGDKPDIRPLDSSFLLRVFYVFAALAALSLALSVAGKWIGRQIVLAGHTASTAPVEVVIANDVFVVPANMIRAEHARRDGVAERLDLYLSWPAMRGYSHEEQGTFNHVPGHAPLIFLSIEEKAMSRDMSGRFEPIYRTLVEPEAEAGPEGVAVYRFSARSGYLNETLAVAHRMIGNPFVARCLTGQPAENSIAPCQRDIDIGGSLSLSYRFPAELLGDWRELDEAVATWLARYRLPRD